VTFSWGKVLECEADFAPLPSTGLKDSCSEKVGTTDNSSDLPLDVYGPGYQLCPMRLL
jgi:hypothetical protein